MHCARIEIKTIRAIILNNIVITVLISIVICIIIIMYVNWWNLLIFLILSSYSVSRSNTVSIRHRFELAKVVITLCTPIVAFYDIVVNPFIYRSFFYILNIHFHYELFLYINFVDIRQTRCTKKFTNCSIRS